jgi:LAO/AO transport system kinase
VSEARRDLEQMLGLSSSPSAWRPPVLATVASTGEGTDELWAAIARHRAHLRSTGALEERRRTRTAVELRRVLRARLDARAREWASEARFADAVAAIAAGRLDPYAAADELLRGLLDTGERSGE